MDSSDFRDSAFDGDFSIEHSLDLSRDPVYLSSEYAPSEGLRGTDLGRFVRQSRIPVASPSDSDSDGDSSTDDSLDLPWDPVYLSSEYAPSGGLRGTDIGRFVRESRDPVANPSESGKTLISVTRRTGILTMF